LKSDTHESIFPHSSNRGVIRADGVACCIGSEIASCICTGVCNNDRRACWFNVRYWHAHLSVVTPMTREDFDSEVIELLEEGLNFEDLRVQDLFCRAEESGFNPRELLYMFL